MVFCEAVSGAGNHLATNGTGLRGRDTADEADARDQFRTHFDSTLTCVEVAEARRGETMSDIVEKLSKDISEEWKDSSANAVICAYEQDLREAKAEIERLRVALREIGHGDWSDPSADSPSSQVYTYICVEMQDIAKRALAGK